jgi:hypothetical protein
MVDNTDFEGIGIWKAIEKNAKSWNMTFQEDLWSYVWADLILSDLN